MTSAFQLTLRDGEGDLLAHAVTREYLCAYLTGRLMGDPKMFTQRRSVRLLAPFLS